MGLDHIGRRGGFMTYHLGGLEKGLVSQVVVLGSCTLNSYSWG